MPRRETTSREGREARRAPARDGRHRSRARRYDARRRRIGSPGAYRTAAQQRLRRFRQGTSLAVAVTGLALVLWGVPAGTGAAVQPAAAQVPDTATQQVAPPAAAVEQGVADTAAVEVGRAVYEARRTVRELAVGFAGLLPKLAFALIVLIGGWMLTRLLRPLLRRALGSWEKGEAVSIVAAIAIWIFAAAVALSIVAGDVRALVGSVGLLGLALSWALQSPIESATAYLLNSFRGYYRVGDRIAVGDVFGDVYRIDLLTTTVWEAGGPEKSVQGAQPTGALTTFPNSEVLRGNIINYTRDFPYVWDEVVVGVANESDIGYAMRVAADTARDVVGPAMRGPIENYRSLLQDAKLTFDVDEEPQVYLAPTDSWINLTVRYLVPARERRRWASSLVLALSERMAVREHGGRIIGAYPVTRIEVRDSSVDRDTLPDDSA